jgi:hypothetical protein
MPVRCGSMSMNAGVHACVHVLVCTHNTMHMLPIRRPVSASRRISSMGSIEAPTPVNFRLGSASCRRQLHRRVSLRHGVHGISCMLRAASYRLHAVKVLRGWHRARDTAPAVRALHHAVRAATTCRGRHATPQRQPSAYAAEVDARQSCSRNRCSFLHEQTLVQGPEPFETLVTQARPSVSAVALALLIRLTQQR